MPQFIPIIFVSSTKQDLEDYRQALITTFPALEVLFRGMEYFGSRTGRPKEVMLQELRECDLYVGILAHRYGSIDDDTGWSFTELEYREAIRNNIPIIFFLIDPGHPFDPRMIEKDISKINKLESLKREIQTNYTTVFFTTPDDLANKAVQAIRRWVDEHIIQWQALDRAARPLLEREKQFIEKLYETNEDTTIRALRALKNIPSRTALEHFFALLHHPNISRRIKEEILDSLSEFSDIERSLDILLVALKDREASIRSLSAFLIGERAIQGKSLTVSVLDSLTQLSLDPEAIVREEVGHALGKIGIGYTEFTSKCIECLSLLQKDVVPDVRERAVRSVNNIINKFPHLASVISN
jgi:HEAT repeat protein